MKRLGSILRFRKGKPPKTDISGTLPILTPYYLRTGLVETLAKITGREVVLSGDEIVLLWDGSNAGEFFRARPGVLSSTMVVFDFDKKETKTDYLFYELKRFEPDLKSRTAGSGIPHVDKEILLSYELLDKSPQEQDAIADVLLMIDKLIEQTELLLVKQQRIKAGLIHDLLTRGLDELGQLRDFSTHRFKPSLFGDIPDEWRPSTVGVECTKVCVGIVIRPAQYYSTQGVIALRSLNVKAGFFDLSDVVRITYESNARLSKSRLIEGDVVTVRTGEPGTSAVIGPEMADMNCIDLLISHPRRRLRSDFLALWMNSSFGQKHVSQNQGGLAQQHFNVGEMKLLPIPVPELDEQDAIIMRAKAMMRYIDELSDNLEKLRRVKTGLMQDLLTGIVSIEPLLAATKG